MEMTSAGNNPGAQVLHPATLEINVLEREIQTRRNLILACYAQLKANVQLTPERIAELKGEMQTAANEIQVLYQQKEDQMALLNSDSVLVRCTKCPQVERLTLIEADRRAPFICPACWLAKYLDEHPELK